MSAVPADRSARRAAEIAALRSALAAHPDCAALAEGPIEPLREKGLAHAHLRLGGADPPLLARVPRLSQFGLPAAHNLAYQAACFERVAPSGHGPRLHAVLPPSRALPMGALLVEEIRGDPPRVADPAGRDMALIAAALAAIHRLPLPPPEARAPLADHADPVRGTLEVIRRQAVYFDALDLAPATRGALAEELRWAEDLAADAGGRAQPQALVATDTHPGNFLMPDGAARRAVIVDLEKALYGAPAIDVAHASLPTSTTFDPDCGARLEREQVAAFYHAYLAARDPADAAAVRPWLPPLRRLTWLRTLTWFARWRVESARAPGADGADAQDWSADAVDAGVVAHVRARIAEAFEPGSVDAVRTEWLGPAPLDDWL